MTDETPPTRGSQVEAWLIRWRDSNGRVSYTRDVVEELLIDLHERADIGADWDHVIDHSNGQPTIIGVAGVEQDEIDTLVAALMPLVGPEDAYGVAIATVRAGWRPKPKGPF